MEANKNVTVLGITLMQVFADINDKETEYLSREHHDKKSQSLSLILRLHLGVSVSNIQSEYF